jgi:hypothetical protein
MPLLGDFTSSVKDDWQPRFDLIKTIMSYLKGGIHDDSENRISLWSRQGSRPFDLRSAL